MTELGYSIIGSTPEQMAEMNKAETSALGADRQGVGGEGGVEMRGWSFSGKS